MRSIFQAKTFDARALILGAPRSEASFFVLRRIHPTPICV